MSDLLETFRESANPRTLAEANVWCDELATEAEGFESALAAVASSHDNNCSPELRHAARSALGLGPCEKRQDCPFCDDAARESHSQKEPA